MFSKKKGWINETSELLLGILATVAQEESISISQNVKWTRRKCYEIGQPVERAGYGFRYCGQPLYQRAINVQSGSGRSQDWCCEIGEDACKNFVMRSDVIEKAVLEATKRSIVIFYVIK